MLFLAVLYWATEKYNDQPSGSHSNNSKQDWMNKYYNCVKICCHIVKAKILLELRNSKLEGSNDKQTHFVLASCKSKVPKPKC